MTHEIHVTNAAKEWLNDWLQPSHIGYEFGCGESTIWLGKRVKQLTSVENKQLWYDRVKGWLEKEGIINVKLTFQPKPPRYIRTIIACKELLDFVYVDGIERLACVTLARDKVKPNGIIIFDNSDRLHWQSVSELLPDWKELKFHGEGLGGTWQTTIFVRTH